MKRERAQEIYSDYEEGTLSPAMTLALEQHFEADPAAKADFDDFSRIFALLTETSAESLEAPHGFRAGILDRIAAESATKKSLAAGAPLSRLREMFSTSRRREAVGALVAVVTLAVVSSVALKPMHNAAGPRTSPSGPGSVDSARNPAVNPSTSSLVPLPATPAESAPVAVIQGAASHQDTNGVSYQDVSVQLPPGIPSATVDAYAISATEEILDPAVRNRDATLILRDETMTSGVAHNISVALAQQVPSGTTLNILVEWHSGPSGATSGSTAGDQIVFAPIGASDVTPQTAPPSNGNFFDSLQTIASAYHAVVIADAETAPLTTVKAWSAGQDVRTALGTVAVSAGYGVKALGSNTYYIYRQP